MTEVLTSSNWQTAAQEAVADLPADLRASVGHRRIDDRTYLITVASEPIDPDDGETRLRRIQMRYWNNLREYGWPTEHDALYRSGGCFANRVVWPIISILGESTYVEEGLFPGRATVGDMKQHVQVAILEELYLGGGMSTITKDLAGRFRRQDGTPVLRWQFQKQKKYS